MIRGYDSGRSHLLPFEATQHTKKRQTQIWTVLSVYPLKIIPPKGTFLWNKQPAFCEQLGFWGDKVEEAQFDSFLLSIGPVLAGLAQTMVQQPCSKANTFPGAKYLSMEACGSRGSNQVLAFRTHGFPVSMNPLATFGESKLKHWPGGYFQTLLLTQDRRAREAVRVQQLGPRLPPASDPATFIFPKQVAGHAGMRVILKK